VSQVFHIVPGTVRGPAAAVLVALVALVTVVGVLVPVILYRSLSGARTASFEVSPSGLQLKGDLYGRLIPTGELRAAEARRVDLETQTSLQPRTRTLGTALPGYRSGWFRLRNGEKALVYVTDPNRVVYVPTNKGYSVLVSVQETDSFVDALHALAR
jgi:hypothetical protein